MIIVRLTTSQGANQQVRKRRKVEGQKICVNVLSVQVGLQILRQK